MAKPSEASVRTVLARFDRDKKALASVQHGWFSLTKYPGHGHWRRKTTRASVVWEDTIDKAIELFDGDPGVATVHHYDTVSFIFDDQVLLRFKKADLALRSSNVRTELADLFHDPDADLFGHPGLQRVEVCHVLNTFETELSWVGIVARDNTALLWSYGIDDGSGETVVPLPMPVSGDPANLATLKDVGRDKEEKKDAG